MNSFETMRNEILRLARPKGHPVYLDTRRISALYCVPERSVRIELARLATQRAIKLAAWDGRQVRPFEAWRSADEFVDSKSGDGHVHLGPGNAAARDEEEKHRPLRKAAAV
jgi:hypothetical protein